MKPVFPNAAAEFVFTRSYAHWLPEQNRRETWPETVQRYVQFLREQRGSVVPEAWLREIQDAILDFEVMPSMRAMWAAGTAATHDNLTMYNCSASSIDSVESFAECLYILMCGAGYGFSVTRETINKLPVVADEIAAPTTTFSIPDSRAGWADSLKVLMYSLYAGQDIDMDYSAIRPKGTRLKTMGGRASGPEPLRELHAFIRETFKSALGRRLKPIECHDICNKIAEIVVVGGVRRSSEISLSDLNDEEMRSAKVWPFPVHRSMANNSVVYSKKPADGQFWAEWKALELSGTGERGIFNLQAVRALAPARRDASKIELTNPCGEISLRSMEMCNLSEVVVRAADDMASLSRKVRVATIIGAIQSTFTYFPYLRKQWAANCEEERLLGVSLTGIMDAPHLLTADNLRTLKRVALNTAAEVADFIGINMPVAVTCVKPSGTVSQLVNSASGIHPRYAQHYIRRYRISGMDPLYQMMREQGFVFVPEVGQELNPHTWVVEFPVAAPAGAVCREAVSAIDQLELYKLLQENWCEHNASLTVYVPESDWQKVGEWVYENWNVVKGVSFLPWDSGAYKLAPYEVITEQQYQNMSGQQRVIDYSQLSRFEKTDTTEGAKTYSCVGDKCELK